MTHGKVAAGDRARIELEVCGPNLRDQSKGEFHVHAAGCRDLRRYGRDGDLGGDGPITVHAADCIEVAEFVYGDIIAEHGETAASYVGEFHFAPCCEGRLKVTEPRLYTASWKQALANANEDVVIVRTSIGKPRWAARAAAALPSIKELMPYGLMGKDLSWPDFVLGYRERLDTQGPDVLGEIFNELRQRHGGRPLVLVCFEHDPRQCHRGVFANWWLEQTGELVPEWPSGDHAHVSEEPPPEPRQRTLI